MTWNYIWKLLLKGYRIKRSGWIGYWAWENGTIMIHEANGNVLDIRETPDPEFTFGNMAADDWVVCGEENVNERYLNFERKY